MQRGSILAIALAFGVSLLATGTVFGDAGRGHSLVILAASKTVIDKSCIMMCDEWGEHGCKKWVMRCKGDPGYPKGLTLSR